VLGILVHSELYTTVTITLVYLKL